MRDDLTISDRNVRTYALSPQPFVSGLIGLFVGLSARATDLKEWISRNAVQEDFGHEEGEKFEFSICCFGNCGPTIFENLEDLYSFVVGLLSLPARLLTDFGLALTGYRGLDFEAGFQLENQLLVHFNIATYVLIGYLIHRKT